MTIDQSSSDAASPELQPTFAELGVRPETVSALAEDGIERTFPIQAQTLPLAMDGHDLIGQAKTGTGKTLGFGVPILEQVQPPGERDGESSTKPQALVVVPTRELCVQVGKDLSNAGRHRGVRVLTIYGGRSYEPQIDSLQKGVEVVVGTPGRLIDLVGQRYLFLDEIKILVLDEADEMLDMGFLPDVEKIVEKIPQSRQTMLFSATMPGKIVALARRYMQRPTHIRASDPNDESATVDAIEQHVWRAHPVDKIEVVARILQAEDRGLTMIFSRTKRKTQKITDELTERGFAAASVHGDLGQGAREQALRAFRNGKVDVLVATEVAARGIDVEAVTHVINYECPDDEKAYIHRIGRTGRAGLSGTAITLVDWEDVARWKMIDRALKLPFSEPIETYSTSDHIYSGLGIPRDAKGYLPRTDRTREGLGAEAVEDLGETGKRGHSRGSDSRGGRPDRSRSRGSGGGRNRGGERNPHPSGSQNRNSPDRSEQSQPRESASDSQGNTRTSETEQKGGTRRRRRRRRPGSDSAGGTASQ